MLLSYAAKQGKVGKRYLETVAIDWADKGIDTFDKAEEYITQLEEIGSNEHKIRTILGIYDRAITFMSAPKIPDSTFLNFCFAYSIK